MYLLFIFKTAEEFGKVYNGFNMDMHNSRPKHNKVFEADPTLKVGDAVGKNLTKCV